MTGLLLLLIYLSFISLGLPDSLLGAAWPTIYPEFGVDVSRSGVIFLITAAGTVVSSLLSDRFTKKCGVGLVTLLSVATTALALFGFSISHSFFALCLWSIPYGIGAGSVDAALNNYVALHYKSAHMSWLHCMWGVGASVGPYLMSAVLLGGGTWNTGYRRIGFLQTGLCAVLLLALPLWKRVHRADASAQEKTKKTEKPIGLKTVFSLNGAGAAMLCFFCYCALEQTTGLWGASYLVLVRGIDPATAARYASLFFLGITIGRAFSGLLALRLSDEQMVTLGQAVILIGIVLMLLPGGNWLTLCGLVTVGLGCAPIYPSLLHATPAHFGAEYSQAVMGVQMACAYVGTSLMPPLFGAISRLTGLWLLPVMLLLFLGVMLMSHRGLCRRTGR